MEKSKIFGYYAVLAILLIAAITGWVSFANYKKSYTTMVQAYVETVSDYEYAIQGLTTRYEDTENKLEDTENKLENAENKLEESENKLEESENKLEIASATITEKESELSQAGEEIAVLVIDNLDLKEDIRVLRPLEDLLCDDQISMDYSGLLNSTSRISSYVGTLSHVSRVSLTWRTELWNNRDSRIHGISFVSRNDNKAYLKQYLIYYNEGGMKQSAFDIGNQCWLDAP